MDFGKRRGPRHLLWFNIYDYDEITRQKRLRGGRGLFSLQVQVTSISGGWGKAGLRVGDWSPCTHSQEERQKTHSCLLGAYAWLLLIALRQFRL